MRFSILEESEERLKMWRLNWMYTIYSKKKQNKKMHTEIKLIFVVSSVALRNTRYITFRFPTVLQNNPQQCLIVQDNSGVENGWEIERPRPQ